MMTPRLKFLLVILLFLSGTLLGSKLNSPYEFFDPIVDIYHDISKSYYDQPNQTAMREGAIEGMLSKLNDPYTDYLSPEVLEEFDKQTRGTFTGVGAEITQNKETKQITVVTPLEDSPALEAGVLAGDAILTINGETTQGMTTEQAVKKIVGPEGTPVTLKLRHADGKEVELTITRKTIHIQTVKGFRRNGGQRWDYLLDHDNGIGYVRLSQFSEPSARELGAAIESAKTAGLKGLILDMRFNPGGLLEQAIEISDMFLSKGTIVSSKGRNRPEQVWKAKADNDLGDFPIVVLVNEGSASAAEIVAGALKDNNRAVIVGTRSFGKGSVQEVHSLSGNNGALKVTTALYYLPSGRNLHRREGADTWGVDPNDGFYVPMTNEQIEKMVNARLDSDILRVGGKGEAEQVTPGYLEKDLSDPQLAAAYKAMLGKLKTGEFPHVGASNATLMAHLTEKARLDKAHENLEKQLAEVDKRLKALDEKIGKEQGGAAAKEHKPVPGEKGPEPEKQLKKQPPAEVPAK